MAHQVGEDDLASRQHLLHVAFGRGLDGQFAGDFVEGREMGSVVSAEFGAAREGRASDNLANQELLSRIVRKRARAAASRFRDPTSATLWNPTC